MMLPPFWLYLWGEETAELGEQMNKSLVTSTPQKVSYPWEKGLSTAKTHQAYIAMHAGSCSQMQLKFYLVLVFNWFKHHQNKWCHHKINKMPPRQGTKQDTGHYPPLGYTYTCEVTAAAYFQLNPRETSSSSLKEPHSKSQLQPDFNFQSWAQ